MHVNASNSFHGVWTEVVHQQTDRPTLSSIEPPAWIQPCCVSRIELDIMMWMGQQRDVHSTKSKRLFAPYLLILGCLVATVEKLEVQVFVLLEELLKLILLNKRSRKKTVSRSWKVTVIGPEHRTQTQHAVSDSECIIHLRRLIQVLYVPEAAILATTVEQ